MSVVRILETVDRALRVLGAFDSPGQELSVSALASRLGIHRSGASRLAGTLAERGFLERSPHSEAFRLGPEMRRLGLLAVASSDLVAEARPVMAELAKLAGETVVLSVPDGDVAVDVAQVDGPHLVGAKQWIGQRSPLHTSSDGKVLLAWGDVDVDTLPLTGTSTSRAAVVAEVERVRTQGWAGAVGELEEGLNGVAAPVRDQQGRCVAALSISAPEYRLPADDLPELAAKVCAAADRLSAQLGHR